MKVFPIIHCGCHRESSLLVAALAALLTGFAGAQTSYTSFELERDNNWEQQIAFADLNGDGLKDIVHANYQDGIGRELHVFHQRADGSYSTTAQRIEIKTEIIAVAFADLRADPGSELLLISSSGVFSLSSAVDGYAGNIRQLINWDLIAAVPDLERVQFLDEPRDIDGDGEIDLLLPGNGVYGLFKGRGDESFELVSTFSSDDESLTAAQRRRSNSGLDARISINAEEGVVIELSVESESDFEDFVEQWNVNDEPERSLLRAERWMPTSIFAQLNDDSLLDVAYINQGADGLGQLNFHFQDAQLGFNSEPDWKGSFDKLGDIQLVDLNNDGQLDLLRLTGERNDRTAYFYRNLNGSLDLERPNQVMRFSGYDVRLNIVQLQNDTVPLLNVSYYTIPVVDAIRNASINRIQLLYGSENALDGQFFNRRPNSRLDESFSAANVRGLSEQMSLLYDVDGDGRKDAIYVTDNGTLAAKRINSELTIEAEPFWEYVSANTVFEFQVLQLNQDDRPDLLLRHGGATSFLVATP